MSQTEPPHIAGGYKGTNPHPPALDLTAIRTGLSASSGQQYWRSLEELANTEAFQEFLQPEVTWPV